MYRNAQGLTSIPAFILLPVLVGVFNTHIHTHRGKHMHTYTHTCTQSPTHVQLHPTYTNTYIQTPTHSYTHTHSSGQTHANARLDTFALKLTSTHSLMWRHNKFCRLVELFSDLVFSGWEQTIKQTTIPNECILCVGAAAVEFEWIRARA